MHWEHDNQLYDMFRDSVIHNERFLLASTTVVAQMDRSMLDGEDVSDDGQSSAHIYV